MNSYRVEDVGGEEMSKIDMDGSKFLNEESHLNLGGCMDTERMMDVPKSRPEDIDVEAEEASAPQSEPSEVEFVVHSFTGKEASC